MKKDRILFVVDTLAQHGAERYLYEVLKVLIKHKFEVTVCSVMQLHGHHSYYVKYIQDLNINVYILPLDLYPQVKPRLIRRVLNSFAYRFVDKFKPAYISEKVDKNLSALAKNYSVISIIKWEVYINRFNVFDALENKKIHIMSTLAQYVDYPYNHLPKGKTDFIALYPEQKEEILRGRNEHANLNFFTIPLLIENDNWVNRYSPLHDGILRIGIFSRINYDQPTAFAFSVIHELKLKGVSVELYFFGRYYDENFYKHYLKTVEVLKINNEVKFVGHVEDIGSAIEHYNLNMAMMNCMDSIVGYSSIEIQSHGLPVVFFNVTNSGYNSEEIPVVCNTIPEMTSVISTLWNENKLKEFSDQTFLYSKKSYGIQNYYKKITSIYRNV